MPGKPPPSSHRLHVRQLVSLRVNLFTSVLRDNCQTSVRVIFRGRLWKASRWIFAIPRGIMGDARVRSHTWPLSSQNSCGRTRISEPRTSSVSRNERQAIYQHKRSLTCGEAFVVVRHLLVVALCFAGFPRDGTPLVHPLGHPPCRRPPRQSPKAMLRHVWCGTVGNPLKPPADY